MKKLKPIIERPSDWDRIEAVLKEYFLKTIYLPVIAELKLKPQTVLKNSDEGDLDELREAVQYGRLFFHRGLFKGAMTADISRALKGLGAVWDRKERGWRIPLKDLPYDVRAAISGSLTYFQKKVEAIDRKLSEILPGNFSDQIKVSKLFDQTLWRTDREFRESVKSITITPELAPPERKLIADEWENNMRLWVKDFTAEQIVKLRADVKKSVFEGNRPEALARVIQSSYRVSENKAKFLARQETALLMTNFKQARYKQAGIYEYEWHAVAGSAAHPVRPQHKHLADESAAGKIFSWDKPPITSEPGEPERRNNPGQDYNCRCYAIPVVRA